MALHADGQLLGATERMKNIEYNTYLIEKMRVNSPAAAQREKADAMIRQMETSLEALASDIRTVDNSYASYKARNYLSFRSTFMRFMDRIDVVSTVISTIILFCMAFTAVFLFYFIKKRDRKA